MVLEYYGTVIARCVHSANNKFRVQRQFGYALGKLSGVVGPSSRWLSPRMNEIGHLGRISTDINDLMILRRCYLCGLGLALSCQVRSDRCRGV